jgi:cytochrome c-type biogenesis protein CcmH/NrfG
MPSKKTVRLDQVVFLAVGCLIVGYFFGLGTGFYVLRSPAPTPGPASAPAPAVAPPGAALGSLSAEIRELGQIVEKDPKNRAAWVRLGNLHFDANQHAESIHAYTKALELDPKDPDVLTDRGVMYRAIGEYQLAAGEFRKAAEIDPKHLNSLMNLGVVLRDLKDVEGAAKAWQSYLDRNPPPELADRIRKELEALKAQRK